MERFFSSASEDETKQIGAMLARALHGDPHVFVRLKGELGAGKSAFARGFIATWGELNGEPVTESIVSPTYNIVKTYGTRQPLAHLDLYRIKTMEELEQLGFEHYFYELSACVVEWLEQVPEALARMPVGVEVQLTMDNPSAANSRMITVKSLKEISLKP